MFSFLFQDAEIISCCYCIPVTSHNTYVGKDKSGIWHLSLLLFVSLQSHVFDFFLSLFTEVAVEPLKLFVFSFFLIFSSDELIKTYKWRSTCWSVTVVDFHICLFPSYLLVESKIYFSACSWINFTTKESRGEISQIWFCVTTSHRKNVLYCRVMFSGHLCPPSTFSSKLMHHAENCKEFLPLFYPCFQKHKYMADWLVTSSCGKPGSVQGSFHFLEYMDAYEKGTEICCSLLM